MGDCFSDRHLRFANACAQVDRPAQMTDSNQEISMRPEISMRQRVCELARTLQERPQVLVVEDDPDDVFLLQRVLESQGCDVLIEKDGTSAAKLFDQCGHHPFDIVFLDLQLPGKSGVTVLEAAHRAMPKTPVVIITGYSQSEMVRQASALGFVELARKPLTEETIIRIFNTHRIVLPSREQA